jgi:hypothetical protein
MGMAKAGRSKNVDGDSRCDIRRKERKEAVEEGLVGTDTVQYREREKNNRFVEPSRVELI